MYFRTHDYGYLRNRKCSKPPPTDAMGPRSATTSGIGRGDCATRSLGLCGPLAQDPLAASVDPRWVISKSVGR